MLIECTIQRENGSTITVGSSVYRFAPRDGDPRHVAVVENPDHAARFLAIDAYQAVEAPTPVKPAPQVTADTTPATKPAPRKRTRHKANGNAA